MGDVHDVEHAEGYGDADAHRRVEPAEQNPATMAFNSNAGEISMALKRNRRVVPAGPFGCYFLFSW